MIIRAGNIGKRYNSEWIFRGIDFEFSAGNAYAILGANGSGKSTLLQLIGGNISPSEGNLSYHDENSKTVEEEKIFRYLSFASPYLEFPEEMTLCEMIEFHFRFKKRSGDLSVKQIIETLGLEKAAAKQLRYFSSGMKQRIRLGLAILSDTPLLLLDEPTSNLDKNGIDWYRRLIGDYSKGRLIIVCSNHQEQEYDFCVDKIIMENYKIQPFRTK